MPAESAKGVIDFLVEKTSEHACPMCGTKGWKLATDVAGTPVTVTYVFSGSGHTGSLLEQPCYHLHCNNCGFVRQHMAKLVDDWLAAPMSADP